MTSSPCLEEVQSFTLDAPSVFQVVANPAGGFVTKHFGGAGLQRGGVRVWGESGEAVATLEGSHARCVACGPRGEVALGCYEGTAEVWQDNACVLTLTGLSGVVYGVAVSPLDGSIVTGAMDMMAKVWSRSTGECVATLEGHTSFVDVVCVLDTGDVVTGSSHERAVRVWERGSWTLAAVCKAPSVVWALEAMPLGGFAAGGGSHVAADGFVAAWRGGVQQWAFETKQQVPCLAVVGDIVLCFALDECMLIVEGTIVSRWDASYAKPVALRGGKVALFDGNSCTVFRVVRPSRLGAIRVLVAAWGAHGGVPPPHAALDGRVGALTQMLSLRRVCRPRGETGVGRATEIVEPFGQGVVAYL